MSADLTLDSVPGALCELLGRAGERAAVDDGVELVQAIERCRAEAPPREWADWDEAQARALKTLSLLREYADGEPPPPPPVVPLPPRMRRPCEVRRRRP